MITRRIFSHAASSCQRLRELVAKDDCPIRGGHPRLPRIGRHRGRANPRVSEAGRERAKPARRSAARRLVSLGSLSVPGLQAWGSGPDRLRRGNRARIGAHPGRGNPPAGNRLERASGGAGRRDCGYRGRRDKERGAQRICVLLEAVSQRDRRPDSPQGRGQTIRVLDDRRDARDFRETKIPARSCRRLRLCRQPRQRVHCRSRLQGLDRAHRE